MKLPWIWFKKILGTKPDNEKSNITITFPCSSDNCLVRAACTKPCEKIVWDEKQLWELIQTYRRCPDCGSEHIVEGPSGGASTNVKCTGCGHYFNLGIPLFVERIHCSEERFYKAW